MLQLEGVKNHTPEVLVVDEIGDKHEAVSCETIARRGVVLISTVHGESVESLVNNPDLVSLIGGIQSVILSDRQAKRAEKRGLDFQKTVGNWKVHRANS